MMVIEIAPSHDRLGKSDIWTCDWCLTVPVSYNSRGVPHFQGLSSPQRQRDGFSWPFVLNRVSILPTVPMKWPTWVVMMNLRGPLSKEVIASHTRHVLRSLDIINRCTYVMFVVFLFPYSSSIYPEARVLQPFATAPVAERSYRSAHVAA